MIKMATYFAALVLTVAMSSVAVAQELEPSLTNHPAPALAAYYREHTADINFLRAQTMQGESAQRLKALEQLSVEYPDAAFNTAIKLLDDSTLEIALEAAELLADAIVLSDHHTAIHDDADLNPYQKYTIAQHAAARAALLDVLVDPRAELREAAAGTLVSLSDEEALRRINVGIQQGLYTETQVVNYTGLADPDVGRPYLEPYLEAGSNGARAAAVMYLGSNAQYQARIRDSILLNSKLDPSVRSAAAYILSIYDPNYQSYALILTLDPNLPTTLYTSVVEGYVDSLQADNLLNPVNARVLRTAIQNYQTLNPEVNLAQIERRLEQYGE